MITTKTYVEHLEFEVFDQSEGEAPDQEYFLLDEVLVNRYGCDGSRHAVQKILEYRNALGKVEHAKLIGTEMIGWCDGSCHLPQEGESWGGSWGENPEWRGETFTMKANLSKKFESFTEGLGELTELSFSAEQAIVAQMPDRDLDLLLEEEDALAEKRVREWLRDNEEYGIKPVSFEEGHWGDVRYVTSGGLAFGWFPEDDESIVFWVGHPEGVVDPTRSTLAGAAYNRGWSL